MSVNMVLVRMAENLLNREKFVNTAELVSSWVAAETYLAVAYRSQPIHNSFLASQFTFLPIKSSLW